MRKAHGGGGTLIGFGFVIACATAILLLAKGLYPADLPASRNPDFIDNIFNNRGVLWAPRLLLVSATAASLRESLKRYEELFEELEHLR